ncbi:unnamed protein product [Orchesella dallaii]|uniref:Transmembrane protein n=1 Tax=Orchesella dallaii TaxID=48710 RepID=A0ABP1RLC7_9HEXA
MDRFNIHNYVPRVIFFALNELGEFPWRVILQMAGTFVYVLVTFGFQLIRYFDVNPPDAFSATLPFAVLVTFLTIRFKISREIFYLVWPSGTIKILRQLIYSYLSVKTVLTPVLGLAASIVESSKCGVHLIVENCEDVAGMWINSTLGREAKVANSIFTSIRNSIPTFVEDTSSWISGALSTVTRMKVLDPAKQLVSYVSFSVQPRTASNLQLEDDAGKSLFNELKEDVLATENFLNVVLWAWGLFSMCQAFLYLPISKYLRLKDYRLLHSQSSDSLFVQYFNRMFLWLKSKLPSVSTILFVLILFCWLVEYFIGNAYLRSGEIYSSGNPKLKSNSSVRFSHSGGDLGYVITNGLNGIVMDNQHIEVNMNISQCYSGRYEQTSTLKHFFHILLLLFAHCTSWFDKIIEANEEHYYALLQGNIYLM